MNLPNFLTILRVLLTIGFVILLTRSGWVPIFFATLIFMIASFTDFYDGYYAKKYNLISDFGKIMDPIADKFLILAAFFIFVLMEIIAQWMFYIIFAREFIVTGSRILAMKKGKILAAERAGKYKTLLQSFAVFIILIFILLQKAGLTLYWTEAFKSLWFIGIYILMLLTVSLTLFSGISYLWHNRKEFTLIAKY